MDVWYWKIVAILAIFDAVNGLPKKELSREKRTSDQRLAELETLFALSKMHGKFVTVPIGFGKIDPSKLGRRRRSIGLLIRKLMKNLSGEETTGRNAAEFPQYGENCENVDDLLLDDPLGITSRRRFEEKLPD